MNRIFKVRALSEQVAEIYIYSHIGDDAFDEAWGDVTPTMINEQLREHRGKAINLHVNSNGGNVFAAQAIFNALKAHDGRVTAYVDGIAASAASFIILAADEIIAPRNSLIMIHNPWSVAVGEASDMRKQADFLDKVRDQTLDMYASRATISRDEIREMMDAETYMTGSEAVAMGFADTTGEEDIEVYASGDRVFAGRQTFPRATLGIPERIYASIIPTRTPASADVLPEHTTEPENIMKTAEELRAAHPDLVAEIEASASAAAIEADRKRIQEIEEISAAMPDELVRAAKFETGADARDLALQALRADARAGQRYAKKRSAEQEEGATVNATPPEKDSKTEARIAQAAAMFARKGGRKTGGR